LFPTLLFPDTVNYALPVTQSRRSVTLTDRGNLLKRSIRVSGSSFAEIACKCLPRRTVLSTQRKWGHRMQRAAH